MSANKIADLEKNLQILKDKAARVAEKIKEVEGKLAAEKAKAA